MVVIGGLLLSTVLTLFLTPVLYDLLARFTRPVNAVQERLTAQLHGATSPAPSEGSAMIELRERS